jgi:glutathione synthase
MDPAEKMLPDKDTSFAFMRGALARGHACLHCEPKDLFAEADEVSCAARPITVSDSAPFVTLGGPSDVALAGVDAVLIRKDPPFDAAYLYMTQLLDLVKRRTLVVNDPAGVRQANEKVFALRFSDLMPRTLVSSHPERIIRFVDDIGRAIIKPLDGAGGAGVISLSRGDQNTRAVVDLLTAEGKRLAMVQEFLPIVREGDKRVLVLDGKALGAIRRVPRSDDFRANIHVGGAVEATTLTAGEAQVVASVGPALSKVGLWFVGLDLIAEKLIEVNVTSPTGIQELGRLTAEPVERAVIEWLEERATLVKNG